MDEKLQRKRAGKRLLVAAIGVATVSYVSTQSGCAADGATEDETLTTSDQPYDDEEEADVAVSEQALAATSVAKAALPNTAIPIKIKIKFPPVGNLVAPPVGNLMVPPPVGNLMAPPPVGNLVAPPVVVEPPVGNLMPPPVAIDELAAVRGK